MSSRLLFGEDVEVVEFAARAGETDATLLREIADYVEKSGRCPCSITYGLSFDEESAFTAYLHR